MSSSKYLNKNFQSIYLKDEDTSTFNLFSQKGNNSNIIKKSKSDVPNKIPIINEESNFCLFNNNNNIENDSSSKIIVEESLKFFHNYLDELQKSYINAVDPNLIKNLPEITMNENTYKGIKNCTICRDDIQINEKAIILHCLHIFHSECIKNNFKRNYTCPNCNFKINEENMKGYGLNSK